MCCLNKLNVCNINKNFVFTFIYFIFVKNKFGNKV